MSFPTIGLGAIPPDYALARAAGLGAAPTDPVGLLQAILGELQTLNARLAPPPLMQEVNLDGLAPGEWTNPVDITVPTFNSFLVTLEKGAAIVYLGGARGQRLMRLPAGENPYIVPFPPLAAKQITIVADPAATEPCKGSVFAQSY